MSGLERAGGASPDEGAHAERGDAGQGTAAHGGAEHLMQMANDIGNFFRSEPERKDGIAGIANHIAKYWTPRMRQKLLDHVKEHGEAGLDELPREALKSLAVQPGAAPPHEPPGGDGG